MEPLLEVKGTLCYKNRQNSRKPPSRNSTEDRRGSNTRPRHRSSTRSPARSPQTTRCSHRGEQVWCAHRLTMCWQRGLKARGRSRPEEGARPMVDGQCAQNHRAVGVSSGLGGTQASLSWRRGGAGQATSSRMKGQQVQRPGGRGVSHNSTSEPREVRQGGSSLCLVGREWVMARTLKTAGLEQPPVWLLWLDIHIFKFTKAI